jgi:hypothetical protein
MVHKIIGRDQAEKLRAVLVHCEIIYAAILLDRKNEGEGQK